MIDIKEKYNVDESEWNNYLTFIKENLLDRTYKGYKEKHHIYPRALFPELIKNKKNIVKLSAKNHLKAHLLLYKALRTEQAVILSLNMMLNRGRYNEYFDLDSVEELFDQYAEDYEKFRLYVSETISKVNSGRKLSKDELQRLRTNAVNKVVVKDKNNNIFRVSINDPRYLSGELVYYRVGYKHTEKTKQKMSENGIKGLKSFYNEDGKVVYTKDCPKGFVHGLPPQQKEKMSQRFSGMTYLYNPTTGETIRFPENEMYPNGFIKKREKKGGFVGFDKINENVRCFNIRNGKIDNVNKNEIDLNYMIVGISQQSDKGILNNVLIYFDNMYFPNIDDLNEYLVETYKIKIPQNIANSGYSLYKKYNNAIIDIKLIRNGINERLRENNGKYFKDVMPLKFIKLSDIKLNGDIKLYYKKRTREKYGKRI